MKICKYNTIKVGTNEGTTPLQSLHEGTGHEGTSPLKSLHEKTGHEGTSPLQSLHEGTGRRNLSHEQVTPSVLRNKSQGLVPKIELVQISGTSRRDQTFGPCN